jgi:two-component system response regulator HydG
MKFANYFREKASLEFQKTVTSFSEKVLQIFENYDWPGNLRELRNVVRRSVLLTQGEVVETASIPSELSECAWREPEPHCLSDVKNEAEKRVIIETLEKARYNKTKAARMLGMDRKTLYNKIQKLNIDY